MNNAMRTMMIAAAVLVAAPATAHAKKPKAGDKWRNDEDADAAARVGEGGGWREYEFDNDHVDGERLSPDGVPVPGRVRARFPSLLKIRPHFLRELIGLARDV